jgi:hypothetical protein
MSRLADALMFCCVAVALVVLGHYVLSPSPWYVAMSYGYLSGVLALVITRKGLA